jgi:hypothetical protein
VSEQRGDRVRGGPIAGRERMNDPGANDGAYQRASAAGTRFAVNIASRSALPSARRP